MVPTKPSNLMLALLAAALALVAVPGASAEDVTLAVPSVGEAVSVTDAGGIWVVDCTNAFVSETNVLVGILVYQLTHEVLLDLTSYVSDSGWFAGHEIIAVGQYVDCVTL